MNNKAETFQRFGKAFQEKFCHLMLSDRPFCDQITEVLSVDFLDYEYLRVFIKILTDHRSKYKVHPSYEIMETRIRTDCNNYTKALKEQLIGFYATIKSTDEIPNSQFIKDSSIDFCRKQVLKGAMMKSVKLIKSSSFDEISKVIEEALKLGTDNNFGHDFINILK